MKKLLLVIVGLFLVLTGCSGGGGSSDKQVLSVTINSLPDKLTYAYGEGLNLDGLEVEVEYEDESVDYDVSDKEITGYNPYQSGDQVVTITIGGKTDTFTVKVEEEVIVIDSYKVSGRVMDTEGNSLSGVTLDYGNGAEQSNENGFFDFEIPAENVERITIVLKKDGYFDVTRSEKVLEDIADYEIKATMIAKTNEDIAVTGNVDSSSGGGISLPNGTMVEIAQDSIVDENGNEYTGNVNISMAYLDPTGDEFSDIIPGGSLEAEREDGSSSMLVSFGVIKVELKDDEGNKLQLDGTEEGKSKIEVAVPDSLKENAPMTIPLWYFDDDKGVWVEEGEATLSEDKTKYIGYVEHFTDWNCDYPEDRATIQGYVKDTNNLPIPGVKVQIGQTHAITNEDGFYSRFVPTNVLIDVYIPNHFGERIDGAVVSLSAGEVKTINFEVEENREVTGKLYDSEGNLISGYITIEVDGQMLNIYAENGYFSFKIPLDIDQVDYTAIGNDGTTKTGNTYVSSGQIEINLEGGSVVVRETELYIDGKFVPNIGTNAIGFTFEPDGIDGIYTLISLSNGEYSNGEAINHDYIQLVFPGDSVGQYTLGFREEAFQGYLIYGDETGEESYFTTEENSVTLNVTKYESVGGSIEGNFEGKMERFIFDESGYRRETVDVRGKFSVQRYAHNFYNQYE